MSLREFHYFVDNRPVSFDQYTVIHLEAHQSGAGTFVRLAPVDRAIELHLQEDYATVLKDITESDTDRMFARLSTETDEEGVPF